MKMFSPDRPGEGGEQVEAGGGASQENGDHDHH